LAEIKEVLMNPKSALVRLRHDAALVAEAVALFALWLFLSAQALGQGLVVRLGTVSRSRSRAQATMEILIAMAVLGVIGLGVWKIIGPAIIAKATGVATDLQTSGTGTTGTGG